MDDNNGSDLENVIDRILCSAQELKQKLDLIKEAPQTNENSNLFKDFYQLRKLEKENEQLKHALEEHQYGLEFIMTKYRAQVVELIKLHKIEKQSTLTPAQKLIFKNELVDVEKTELEN